MTSQQVVTLTPEGCVLNEEAAATNFIIRPGTRSHDIEHLTIISQRQF